MEIKIYRHIYHKDIYLARNWNIVGGSETTEFYYATKDIIKAIDNANRTEFLSWTRSFPHLVAKIKDSKEVDIDGYKGVLIKELSFPVVEFECVTLREGI